MSDQELIEELNRLFQTANKIDEGEFVQILIGFNGMGDQRALTHLHESREFIKDIKSMMQGNPNKHSRTRLALLLYCHIFEMDELYNIIGNLLRISMGQQLRYIPDLYNKHNQENLTPTDKLLRLSQIAEQCRFEELVNGINALYSNRIRNAFFHSAYSLIEDDFCIVKGEGIKIGNVLHNVLSIDSFLIPKINSTINFIERFFALIDESKLQYRENKIVQGRLPDPQPIMILGDPIKGLVGFQSFYGSWVKISNSYGTENFVEAMNLRFSVEPKEITELTKKLAPYEEDQAPTGTVFNKIKEEILQTKDKNLIRNLAMVYYNWANNTAKSAEEKSGREKETLLNYALQRYDLSIQSDSTFSRAYHNRGTAKLKLALFKSILDNNVRWEAIEEIKNALKYEPLMFEAHLNFGKLLLEIAFDEKDTEKKILLLKESIERYNKAIDIYPKDSDAYQYLGRIYWDLAQVSKDNRQEIFSSAIQNYEQAIKRKPNIEYYLSLSTLLGDFAESDKDQAKPLYEKSIQILQEAENIFGIKSDTQYRMGNKYMMLAHLTDDEKYLKLASDTFENSVKLDKNNVKAINNLGYCLLHIALKEKSPNDAIKIFEHSISKLNEALSLEPNHETAYYNLGIIYTEIWRRADDKDKMGLLEKSITNLTHGESLKEGLCDYHLARVFALMLDTEKSLFWLDKFLSNNQVEKESITDEKDFEVILNKPELEALLTKYFKTEPM